MPSNGLQARHVDCASCCRNLALNLVGEALGKAKVVENVFCRVWRWT